jgi:hypothetical protein
MVSSICRWAAINNIQFEEIHRLVLSQFLTWKNAFAVHLHFDSIPQDEIVSIPFSGSLSPWCNHEKKLIIKKQ